MKRQIILASTSPRRLELFRLLKIKFKVVDSGYEEVVDPRLSHENMVKFLAMGKARAVAKKCPKAVIVAADTMVSFRGKIIGKPKNPKEATAMLKSFRGRSQDVLTGVVVLDAQTKRVFMGVEKLKVHFKKLSGREIAKYVNSGEPFDKAGGYGPQGPGFNLIEKMEGDFSNSLGLPMMMVFNAMEKLGVEI